MGRTLYENKLFDKKVIYAMITVKGIWLRLYFQNIKIKYVRSIK